MVRTAVLTSLLAAALAAQTDPLEEALRTGGDRPADLTFELHLPGGKSVFRPGEPIVVELVFQAETAGKYRVQAWTQIWHQVPSMDRLEADPPPAEDPLAERYRLGPANGLNWVDASRGMGAGEQVVPVETNATLRLREPGSYRIRAASRRALLLEVPGSPLSRGTPLILVSEPVTVTITDPDPEWEQQQLARQIEALERKIEDGVYPRDHLLAALRMGYLSIPEAADAIVERIGWANPTIGHNLVRALMASPHRERALRKLEAGIEASDQAISERYITALVTLQAFFQGVPDTETDRRRHWKETAKLRAAVHRRLAAALSSKETRARAITLKALLFDLTTGPRGYPTVPRMDWEPLRPMFAKLLPELPLADQEAVLTNRWEAVREPALRPYLLELVSSEDEPVDPYAPTNRMRGLALKRLSDLAPQDARRIVLREAARARPAFDVQFMVHLPDDTLPPIDPVLLERLEDPGVDRSRVFVLLERYATKQIYERVREIESAWLSAGQADNACSTDAMLLAYYLRADEEYGLSRLAKLAKPGGFETDYCRSNLFDRIRAVEPHPKLESLVTPMLNDPSTAVVTQAASWLAQHGSPGASALISRRFEAFHEKWQGRQDELEALRLAAGPESHPMQIELGLSSALFSTEDGRADAARVARLCVTDECRKLAGGGR